MYENNFHIARLYFLPLLQTEKQIVYILLSVSTEQCFCYTEIHFVVLRCILFSIESVEPEILPFAFPSEVQEGQLLQVSCAVTKGDEPMSLQWYKDEFPLASSSQFVINTIQSKLSILLLTSVGADHSGVYACRANNPVGESYQESSLYVHGD